MFVCLSVRSFILKHAMGVSRTIRYSSNLRQIGIAAAAWSGDNEGKIVPFCYPTKNINLSPGI